MLVVGKIRTSCSSHCVQALFFFNVEPAGHESILYDLDPLATFNALFHSPFAHLLQLIAIDFPPSVPSPACAPSSPNCDLTKTGTAGTPPYNIYSVANGSSVRVSYKVAPLVKALVRFALPPLELAFYSSPTSSSSSLTYLADFEASGTGSINFLIMGTQYLQVQGYRTELGPSVRFQAAGSGFSFLFFSQTGSSDSLTS